jgi:GDP-L-fucose synthase
MREEYFDTYVPVDQYGFSKYIMAKYTAGAENIVDLRIFGCFGPYEDWELRFISNAICKTLYDLPITIKQNVFFDYIWIDDLIRITEWFMSNDSRHKHYNACTGRTVDLLSLGELIKDILGKEVPILLAQDCLKPEYSGDNARLLAELPDFQFTGMDEAIRRLAQYYSNNLDKIDRRLLLSDKK